MAVSVKSAVIDAQYPVKLQNKTHISFLTSFLFKYAQGFNTYFVAYSPQRLFLERFSHLK